MQCLRSHLGAVYTEQGRQAHSREELQQAKEPI